MMGKSLVLIYENYGRITRLRRCRGMLYVINELEVVGLKRFRGWVRVLGLLIGFLLALHTPCTLCDPLKFYEASPCFLSPPRHSFTLNDQYFGCNLLPKSAPGYPDRAPLLSLSPLLRST